jgi:hypothetical protein
MQFHLTGPAVAELQSRQALLHACVFFESFEGGVHLLEVRFRLRLITSVP